MTSDCMDDRPDSVSGRSGALGAESMEKDKAVGVDKSDRVGPVKVTVSDPETGKVLEERIVDNDYALICAGKRYVKSIQIMGWRQPTHMIAVAWSKE